MTNFTIKVTDSKGNPISGAQVTATWNQPLAGNQKTQVNTDQEGMALFNIGANDTTVNFLATSGISSGEGSSYVGILGDTSNSNITISLTGNVGNQITNGFVNFINTVKADTTYLVIFGALGGGIVGGAYIIHKIRSSGKITE